MAISIVKLTEVMLPAVFAFERRLSDEEPGYYNWTEDPEYEDKVRASFSGGIFDQALTLVALDDGGSIVGRIDAALLPTHFDGSVKAYLDWICVLKSWRHRGVAQQLMDALREELSVRGIDTLVGLIAANEEAQRFYRAMQGAEIRDEGIWIDCGGSVKP
ncbi:MAG: GNAT family N-acetyltransferase [Clostridia bacterium]|nr:GNAT family N-acetyltransferase [Clostridia bacterium]